MYEVTLPKSLGRESLNELLSLLARAPRDADVWVLQGKDGAFCAGMDLEAASRSEGELRSSVADYAQCLDALRCAARPTVAFVDGETTGGGVGLAAVCDLVIATPRATFALPEALFGLIPALVMPVLVDRIAPQRARYMALSAGSIDAVTAAQLGLVDVVVPAEAAKTELASRVRALSRVDSARVEVLRRWMLELRHLAWPAQLAHGAAITTEMAGDARTKSRIRRFFDDGTPPWIDAQEGA